MAAILCWGVIRSLAGDVGLALEKLHEACRTSDYSAVAAMVPSQVHGKVLTQSVNGKNALHWAAEGLGTRQDDRLKIVTLLLDHSAEVNKASGEQLTPFQYACREGWDRPLLELLIARGADISNPSKVRTARGSGTPLHIAAERLDVELIRFLLEKKAPHSAFNPVTGATPLSTLFQSSRSARDERRRNATITAVRLLMDAGARADTADREGATPLHKAAQAGQLDCVKEFVSRGTSVDLQTREGSNVVHHACLNPVQQHREVIEFLGGHAPALLNSRNARGETPLHVAVNYRNNVAVQTLLLLGANPGIRNNQGERPSDLELFGLEQATAEMLLRYTPEERPPEKPAAPQVPTRPISA